MMLDYNRGRGGRVNNLGKSDYVICQCSLMLILFFMTSTTGQQTVTIHVLPIISRSKVNQTIKFSQLLENNNKYNKEVWN